MNLERTAEQIRAQHTELERLLNRVDCSTSHYDALGLQQSSTSEEIKNAYRQAVALLRPSGNRAALKASDETLRRIDRAFDRVSLAFSVLANASKRIEYDSFLVPKACDKPAPASPGSPCVSGGDNSSQPCDDQRQAARLAAQRESEKAAAEDNRRRCERFDLALKVVVTGHDRKSGKWVEAAETIDVSRTGLTLSLSRRVRHRTIVHLSLPLPTRLRNHGYAEPDYNVYALVRRVEPVKKGKRVVGFEFVGEHPPMGYLDKPWATFQSKSWNGLERRRKDREERSDIIWVEYFTESMQCIRQEAARTENVSQGGMRIFVKGAPSEFELMRITYPDIGIESYAAVCNRYMGKDGFERLCLRFVNNTDLAGKATAQSERVAAAGPLKPVENPAQVETIMAEVISPFEELNHAEPEKRAEAPAQEKVAAPVEHRQQKSAQEASLLAECRRQDELRREDLLGANGMGRKILVADDDPPLRKVLGKILTQAGYEVVLAQDGKEAVEKAKKERPDLVITDGLMPKMHGFLVCKAIKELQSPPKVIMLTAVYTKMNYRWEAKERYGADEMMTKPFEVSELLACIEKQLEQMPRAHATHM
jgi:CheY-like chemotaxis protein